EHSADLSWAMWCLPELVEGAARAGQPAVAAAALERLREVTGPAASNWALGIEARCPALVSEGEGADEAFRDAGERLRSARDVFLSMGAEAFTTRTERELQATGEKVRKRANDTQAQLTAQERQVAELARDGFSNGEIGAQLFISPRTAEYHLHKIFAKLGITSRTQLNRALGMAPRAP